MSAMSSARASIWQGRTLRSAKALFDPCQQGINAFQQGGVFGVHFEQRLDRHACLRRRIFAAGPGERTQIALQPVHNARRCVISRWPWCASTAHRNRSDCSILRSRPFAEERTGSDPGPQPEGHEQLHQPCRPHTGLRPRRRRVLRTSPSPHAGVHCPGRNGRAR